MSTIYWVYKRLQKDVTTGISVIYLSIRETPEIFHYTTRTSWRNAPSGRGLSFTRGISNIYRVRRVVPHKHIGDLSSRTDTTRTSNHTTLNTHSINSSKRSLSGKSRISNSRLHILVKRVMSDKHIRRLLRLMDTAHKPHTNITRRTPNSLA